VIASTSGGVSGFDPEAFEIDATQFTVGNPLRWQLEHQGDDLLLSYTPEPTAAAGVFGTLAALAVRRRRGRRRGRFAKRAA
jgi:hypothetical protein